MTCAPASDTTSDDSAPAIRLAAPGDLLAVIPYLLGFHPADSLVLVGLHQGRIVFCFRADLADPPDPERITTMLAAQSLTGVILVGYGPAERVERPSLDVAAALRAAGLPVLDRLRTYDGRFSSDLCRDSACCPPEGLPLPASSRVAAEATVAGLVALPSRDELAEQIAPVTGHERVAMERATHRAELRLQSVLDSAASPAAAAERMLTDGLAAVRAADRHARADPGSRLTDDEVAWLGVVLAATQVRDEAWLLAERDLTAARALWSDVMRRVTDEYLPAPAALTGFVCWQQGDGAVGMMALGRALSADPSYSMALLLSRALAGGLPPTAWRPTAHSPTADSPTADAPASVAPTADAPTRDQSRSNSLPSMSCITMVDSSSSSAGSTRTQTAPSFSSRARSACRVARRSAPTSPVPTRTSRWTRFLTTLPSGTRWKNSRGPTPDGSTQANAEPWLSGGSELSNSSQLANPSGGGGTTYPNTSHQKRASRSGSAQSNAI